MEFYNHKWVSRFSPRGLDRTAITLFEFTFFSVPKNEVADAWRRHERQHRRQYRRLLYVGFPLAYLVEYLIARAKGLNHLEAYLNNRYEKEAVAAERL